MKEAYRLLKQDRLAAMFYGWSAVDKFFAAWRAAGFYPVGHVAFRKDYASKRNEPRGNAKEQWRRWSGR
jgi:DNA modification methylase